MKEAVMFFTIPTAGHLTPMVALAKLFVNHGFTATIVTFNHPFRPIKVNEDEISRLSSANSMMAFHVLPPVSLGDGYSNEEPPVVFHAVLNAQKENLCNFVIKLCKTRSIRAVTADVFGMVALEVSKQLNIPAYYYTSFGASATAFFLNLIELDKNSNQSLKDYEKNPINFPGLPPVPASEFPAFVLNRGSDSYRATVQTLPNLVKSDGILMNTFESIETKAISALREGICVPSFNMPPVYSIGPLITESQEEEQEERQLCLKWLDSQPKGTVVFLCFGSQGSFIPNQIKQITIGLEARVASLPAAL